MSKPPIDPLSDGNLSNALLHADPPSEMLWDAVSLPSAVYDAAKRIAEAEGVTVDALVEEQVRRHVLGIDGARELIEPTREKGPLLIAGIYEADADSGRMSLHRAEDLNDALGGIDAGPVVLVNCGQPRAVAMSAGEFRRLKLLAGERVPAAAVPRVAVTIRRRPDATSVETLALRGPGDTCDEPYGPSVTRMVVTPEGLPETVVERIRNVAEGRHEDPIIVTVPGLMDGRACFRGTRVLRDTVDAELEAGTSVDDILDRYPTLDREDVLTYVVADAQLRKFNDDAERFSAWLDSLVDDGRGR